MRAIMGNVYSDEGEGNEWRLLQHAAHKEACELRWKMEGRRRYSKEIAAEVLAYEAACDRFDAIHRAAGSDWLYDRHSLDSILYMFFRKGGSGEAGIERVQRDMLAMLAEQQPNYGDILAIDARRKAKQAA